MTRDTHRIGEMRGSRAVEALASQFLDDPGGDADPVILPVVVCQYRSIGMDLPGQL